MSLSMASNDVVAASATRNLQNHVRLPLNDVSYCSGSRQKKKNSPTEFDKVSNVSLNVKQIHTRVKFAMQQIFQGNFYRIRNFRS